MSFRKYAGTLADWHGWLSMCARSHAEPLREQVAKGGRSALTQPTAQAIRHIASGRGSAWTMNQRYISEDGLRRNPKTTDDL
jgi:hypothetical protein